MRMNADLLLHICVYHAETLRILDSAHTYALRGIRGHALQRRDSGHSSAVYKLLLLRWQFKNLDL